MDTVWTPLAAGLTTFLAALGLGIAWKSLFHRYLLERPRGGTGQVALLRGLFPLAVLAGVALGFWFRRPVFGLLVLPLLPLAGRGFFRLRERKRRRELDGSAIAWFHALNGLLRAGVSLPSAIFRLADLETSPFPEALRTHLDDYRDGRSLSQCLDRFRRRGEVDRTASLLALLEMAYRSGLPVCPLLERTLPVLEHERRSAERVADVRRSVFFQAGVVGLAPWALSMVYAIFEPEAAEKVASASWFPWLVGSSLFLELAGGWVLWTSSRFD